VFPRPVIPLKHNLLRQIRRVQKDFGEQKIFIAEL
jgi:hypothetical protein